MAIGLKLNFQNVSVHIVLWNLSCVRLNVQRDGPPYGFGQTFISMDGPSTLFYINFRQPGWIVRLIGLIFKDDLSTKRTKVLIFLDDPLILWTKIYIFSSCRTVHFMDLNKIYILYVPSTIWTGQYFHPSWMNRSLLWTQNFHLPRMIHPVSGLSSLPFSGLTFLPVHFCGLKIFILLG